MKTMRNAIFALVAWPVLAQQPGPAVNAQPVTIDEIAVEGSSRLSLRSVLALSALKIGQTVSEKDVVKACQRIADSGLVTNVEYVYEAYPDRPGVKLILTPHDQLPLVPAEIKISGMDEEEAWKWLQNIDPLFARQMPPTGKAINLYERYLNKFLDTKNRPERARADIDGDAQGNPRKVIFKAVKLREAPVPAAR